MYVEMYKLQLQLRLQLELPQCQLPCDMSGLRIRTVTFHGELLQIFSKKDYILKYSEKE